MDRRRFLQVSGAAAALSALGGCFTAPRDHALPYTRRPADVTPGIPDTYATAWELHGYGVGLLVTAREGLPIKIDGNPDHPASLGGTGPLEQALLMQLYDPERPRWFLRRGAASDARAYAREAAALAQALEADGGARLRLLAGPTASPLLGDLRDRIQERFPRAGLVAWDPLSRDAVHAGTALAFGEALEPLVAWDQLRVLVTLDADVVGEGPMRLADARRLIDARTPGPDMLRLYAVEPTVTLTGMLADHRLAVAPAALARVARALLRELADRHGLPGLAFARGLPGPAAEPGPEARLVAAMANDLVRAGDRGLVVAGLRAPPELHALAWAIDAALGSLQARVRMVRPPVRERSTGPAAVAELAGELRAGAIDTLVVTAFDPAWSAAATGIGEALSRAPNAVYLAPHQDRTAARVAWVVPRVTVLESWGDARAVDGTAGLVQPLIDPVFPGLTEAQLLAPFAGIQELDPHAALRDRWRARGLPADADWDEALRRGVVPGTAAPPVAARLDPGPIAAALAGSAPAPAAGLELQLRPSPALHAGEFGRNPWSLELPDPITRQSWGNAALLSPATARRLGVERGRGVRVAVAGQSVLVPAYPLPGQADEAVTVALGHGGGAGRSGADAYPLRAGGFWSAPGASVTSTPEPVELVLMQGQDREDGRPIALSATRDELSRGDQAFLRGQRGPVTSMYDAFGGEGDPYRWAMAVDLNRCIGCAACVVACQAENNIPTVGPDDMGRGRDMYWIRIDRYWQGPETDPRAVTQPVACVHCEAAPCEYVCPVNATVHSAEGLNEMVYNRCVGTRFCSNNCPYKVRRFNFKGWNEELSPLVQLSRNPEVTVRAQGVMEKCTYCVQRIERARIEARGRGRPIDTAAVVPACAQACPTRAIVFGSLHEPDAPVSRLHRDPRRYDLLHDLGTRPRTAYLVRVRNPNPEL